MKRAGSPCLRSAYVIALLATLAGPAGGEPAPPARRGDASGADAARPAASAENPTDDLPASEEQRRRARAIADNTMSPFCPGTLSHCSSSEAAVWRRDILRWVVEGKTDREIAESLGARAGHSLAGGGDSSWAIALPLSLGAGALALLLVAGSLLGLWGRRRMPPEAEPEPRPVDAALARRLDAELEQLDD